MIGSPASRGAVASTGGAVCARLAAAPEVSAVSAAIAASVIMAGWAQRRLETVDRTAVDRAVVNRFPIPCPDRNACPRLRRSRIISRFLENYPPPSTPPIRFRECSPRFGSKSLIYDSSRGRKGGSLVPCLPSIPIVAQVWWHASAFGHRATVKEPLARLRTTGTSERRTLISPPSSERIHPISSSQSS